jgi:hypothetical protein
MPVLAKLARQYLPQVRKALDDWTKSGSPQQMMSDLADAIAGIDWRKAGQGLGQLADSAKELGPALASVGTDTVGDSFHVLGVALQFAADHADLLRKILPVLLAGLAAYKAAQLANQLAGKDSVLGLIAQIAVTRQLKAATDQLAASTKSLTGATEAQAEVSTATAGGISKMGLAARGAAGVAGMAALTAGASSSSEAISDLGTVAGGALTGFAVGGPIGAAIGGGAGLLGVLAKHLSNAGDAAKDAQPQFASLADTLDDTTGSITDLTRATIYQQLASPGALKAMNALGLSSRTVVSAVTGQDAAQRQLNQTLASEQASVTYLTTQIANATAEREKYRKGVQLGNQADVQTWNQLTRSIDVMKAEQRQRQGNIDAIRAEVGNLRDSRNAKLAEILATQDLSKLYGRMPKRVVTKLDAEGIVPSTRGIAEVAKRFKLLPKQVRAIISVLGVDTTVRQVDKVKQKLADAGKTKVDLSSYGRSMDDQLDRFRQNADGAANSISQKLKEGTGKAKPDLSPFQRGLQQSLSGAKQTASSGGAGVGSSLKQGVLSGVGGLGTELSQQMSAAVNQGINAARVAAQAKSPSRKTEKLGLDLTAGLIRGVQRGSSGVQAVMAQLSDQTTAILAKQLKAREAAIRAHYDRMAKAVNVGEHATAKQRAAAGKAHAAQNKAEARALHELDAAWAKHGKAVARATKDERQALAELGKAQDANAAKLDKAKGKLRDLTQASLDYAANIKASFVAFGDITQLGVSEDQGGVDIAALVDQLKQRAVDAQRFAALVKQLQKEGLNRDQIEQITAAGVDGGLATAEAIQSAIDSGQVDIIRTLNQTSDAIKKAGGDLGDSLASDYYSAGIKAAQGLVRGLESQADRLDRASVKLAKSLVAAIKKALGIKSPSRVFRGIGTDINRGLALGIADTYATKAATSLASNVVGAFGAPVPSSSGGQHLTVGVQLTAQQVSQLERGRAIQLDLDAYAQAGGRRRP